MGLVSDSAQPPGWRTISGPGGDDADPMGPFRQVLGLHPRLRQLKLAFPSLLGLSSSAAPAKAG